MFRSPLRSRYHTLVDHLPRAGLMIHPAMHRVGPITLVHDGPLSELERFLLGHLGGRNVRLQQVEPGTPLRAERVLIPSYVTRPGAGAVPSWYRRWADAVRLAEAPAAPRRFFLDRPASLGHVANRPELDDVLDRHGIQVVDPRDLAVPDLLAMFRASELVVGMPGSGMAHCLFSRHTHVVHLLRGTTVSPELYYLATCKGLPYDFVPAREDPPARDPDRHALDVDVDWLDGLLTDIG
jgi:capsular polysaccharide biosynthesis protein